MTHVTRTRWMPFAPDVIYQTLYDNPNGLEAIVKRIDKIEVLDKEDNVGEAKVVLDLPARKVVETTGQVVGEPPEKLIFRTREPFPLEFQWVFELAPRNEQAGTVVHASLEIDITFFVAVFSDLILRGLLSSELDGDLERMENWLNSQL